MLVITTQHYIADCIALSGVETSNWIITPEPEPHIVAIDAFAEGEEVFWCMGEADAQYIANVLALNPVFCCSNTSLLPKLNMAFLVASNTFNKKIGIEFALWSATKQTIDRPDHGMIMDVAEMGKVRKPPSLIVY